MVEANIIETIQVIFLLSFLGVNSYFDVKQRYIFGDTKFNLLLGTAALSLMIYDYIQEPNLNIFYFIIPFNVILLLKVLKRIQTGDFIILVITCAILPSTQTLPFFALGSIIFSMILIFVYFIGANVWMNVISLRQTGKLFSNYKISKISKVLYFFVSHENRLSEKFVVPVNINKRISLLKQSEGPRILKTEGNIVSFLLPFTPFLLITCIIFLCLDFVIFPRL